MVDSIAPAMFQSAGVFLCVEIKAKPGHSMTETMPLPFGSLGPGCLSPSRVHPGASSELSTLRPSSPGTSVFPSTSADATSCHRPLNSEASSLRVILRRSLDGQHQWSATKKQSARTAFELDDLNEDERDVVAEDVNDEADVPSGRSPRKKRSSGKGKDKKAIKSSPPATRKSGASAASPSRPPTIWIVSSVRRAAMAAAEMASSSPRAAGLLQDHLATSAQLVADDFLPPTMVEGSTAPFWFNKPAGRPLSPEFYPPDTRQPPMPPDFGVGAYPHPSVDAHAIVDDALGAHPPAEALRCSEKHHFDNAPNFDPAPPQAQRPTSTPMWTWRPTSAAFLPTPATSKASSSRASSFECYKISMSPKQPSPTLVFGDWSPHDAILTVLDATLGLLSPPRSGSAVSDWMERLAPVSVAESSVLNGGEWAPALVWPVDGSCDPTPDPEHDCRPNNIFLSSPQRPSWEECLAEEKGFAEEECFAQEDCFAR